MWLLFTLLSTLALTGRNLAGKLGVDKQDPYVVALATVVFSFPVALVAILFNDFSVTESSFWILLIIRIALDTIALLSLLTAFSFKSVSFVVPLLSLSPLLTSIIAYFSRGDLLSYVSIAGIITIAVSCSIVYFSEKNLTAKKDLPDLRKAFILVLLTAIIYSILDPLHPELIERSNAFTYFFISTICFIVVFYIIALIKSPTKTMSLFDYKSKNFKYNFSVGTLLGLEVIFLFLALASTPAVALVSSLRTTNSALSSLGEFAIKKGKFSSLKIIGIIGTVLGVILVTLGV